MNQVAKYDNSLFEGAIDYVVEAWRLNTFMNELVNKISESQIKKRGINKLSTFQKHTDSAMKKMGIEILDFTGVEYEIGLPVNPINLSDYPGEEVLIIEMMMEPVIKKSGSADIIRRGTVVVGRKKK